MLFVTVSEFYAELAFESELVALNELLPSLMVLGSLAAFRMGLSKASKLNLDSLSCLFGSSNFFYRFFWELEKAGLFGYTYLFSDWLSAKRLS